jgi:aspartate/tyrosine/aromatic aminotransferase
MRVALKEELDKLNTGRDWSHITSQIGMFSYTGLTEAQVGVMEKCNCFLMKSGRISMAGLNTGNVKYVAECMAKAVKEA